VAKVEYDKIILTRLIYTLAIFTNIEKLITIELSNKFKVSVRKIR